MFDCMCNTQKFFVIEPTQRGWRTSESNTEFTLVSCTWHLCSAPLFFIYFTMTYKPIFSPVCVWNMTENALNEWSWIDGWLVRVGISISEYHLGLIFHCKKFILAGIRISQRCRWGFHSSGTLRRIISLKNGIHRCIFLLRCLRGKYTTDKITCGDVWKIWWTD